VTAQALIEIVSNQHESGRWVQGGREDGGARGDGRIMLASASPLDTMMAITGMHTVKEMGLTTYIDSTDFRPGESSPACFVQTLKPSLSLQQVAQKPPGLQK